MNESRYIHEGFLDGIDRLVEGGTHSNCSETLRELTRERLDEPDV